MIWPEVTEFINRGAETRLQAMSLLSTASGPSTKLCFHTWADKRFFIRRPIEKIALQPVQEVHFPVSVVHTQPEAFL